MGSLVTVTSRDGTPIAYERSGEGSPLVLVHGTTADHLTWEPVLPELQKHFTVCAIDRRDRGESGDGDAAGYDIEREFEDVVAVIDSIDGPTDVFGHSYGAICALEVALRSGQVRRLILYEGTFPVPKGTKLYPPEALDKVQSQLEAGDQEGALTTFYRDIVLMSPEEIEMMCSLPIWPARVALAPTIPREMRAFESYVSKFDPARLGNLRTPTLIMLGGDSPASEKAAARQPDRRNAPSGASCPQNGAGSVRARGYAVPDAGAAQECERSKPRRWHRLRRVGDTWAEVKEGSQAPGMTVWAIEGYDWSVPGTVSWTIKESNLFVPGGSVSAQVDPGLGGGSRIHVTWNRTGVGLKGRILVGVIKLSGGKPVEASIKQGLDKMLESEQRP